jgi:nucleolysin TIA-1/TIAR
MYGMPQPNSNYGQYGFGGYGSFPAQTPGAPGGANPASPGMPQPAGAAGAALGLSATGQQPGSDLNAGVGQGTQQWDPSAYYAQNYWGGEAILTV